MKKYLFYYIVFYLLAISFHPLHSMECDQKSQEEVTNLINRYRLSPYRPAEKEENEFLEYIAPHYLRISKEESDLGELGGKKEEFLNQLGFLLQKGVHPPLIYNMENYEERWKELCKKHNIENIKTIKDDYISILKLKCKLIYLARVLEEYKYNYPIWGKDVPFPQYYNWEEGENIWRQCVTEEISPLIEEEIKRCRIKLKGAQHFFQAAHSIVFS